MNHFSYPLTIVQINIFEEPQNVFLNQNPRPQTIEPAPPGILSYRVPPWVRIVAYIYYSQWDNIRYWIYMWQTAWCCVF